MITIQTPDMTKCVNVEGSTDPFLDEAKPEGYAFSDYIESVDLNPYTEGTEEHTRYADAMSKLFKWERAQ